MSDRFEREIDELLARLGFAETERRPEPVRPVRRLRRVFPGSPGRLLIVCLAIAIAGALLPVPGARLLLVLGSIGLAVAYLTWIFEPDRRGPAAGWFGQFYTWLYGE